MDEQSQEEAEREPGFLHIVEDGDIIIIITGRIIQRLGRDGKRLTYQHRQKSNEEWKKGDCKGRE